MGQLAPVASGVVALQVISSAASPAATPAPVLTSLALRISSIAAISVSLLAIVARKSTSSAMAYSKAVTAKKPWSLSSTLHVTDPVTRAGAAVTYGPRLASASLTSVAAAAAAAASVYPPTMVASSSPILTALMKVMPAIASRSSFWSSMNSNSSSSSAYSMVVKA